MKKLLMIATAMSFGLAAAQQSTSTSVGVTVNVSNVCTYNPPDMTNVNGLTYSDPNTVVLAYNAITGASAVTSPDYIFRCTKGTVFNSITAGYTYSGSAGPTLAVQINNPTTTSSSNGDIHTYSVQISAANNQFNVPAGTYMGTVTTTISYQ